MDRRQRKMGIRDRRNAGGRGAVLHVKDSELVLVARSEAVAAVGI